MKPAARILQEPEFLTWLGRASPGEAVVYHRGFLAIDRRRVPSRDLNRLAQSITNAAACGLVDLLQQRHGPDDLSYVAVCRRRAASPTVSRSDRT